MIALEGTGQQLLVPPGFGITGSASDVLAAQTVFAVQNTWPRAGSGLDDTGAISDTMAAAIANRHSTMLFSPGKTYKVTAPILPTYADAFPGSLRIVGYGATLRPTTALNGGRVLGLSNQGATDEFSQRIIVEGLRIDGSLTTNTRGIVMGDAMTPASGNIEVYRCAVFGFSGAAARGIVVQNVVHAVVEKNVLARNNINLEFGGTAPALPSLVRGVHNYLYIAADCNILVGTCNMVSLDSTTLEAAQNEAVRGIPPVGGGAIMFAMKTAWVEGNQIANSALYEVNFDGVNASMWPHLEDFYFNSVARSVHLKNCGNLITRNVVPSNVADSFFVDTGCSGKVREWPSGSVPMAGVFKNLSPAVVFEDGAPFVQRTNGGYDQVAVLAGHFVINMLKGNNKQLDVGTGAAYTIDTPTTDDTGNGHLWIKVKNNFAAPLGVATWGAGYNPSEAWVNPTAGNSRITEWMRDWNTGKWQQVGVSSLVANA